MQDFTAFISSCSYHLRTRITTDKKSATEMLMTAFNSMIAVPSQCNYIQQNSCLGLPKCTIKLAIADKPRDTFRDINFQKILCLETGVKGQGSQKVIGNVTIR